ncbi:MAG: ATP-binding protein [Desulfuromusa sp.]|jgi:signal transduction histidine kinase|nr:ATP-binding protein [Desulfuromusa sp.]
MKLRTKVMIILLVTVMLAMGGSGLFFFQQYRKAFRHSVFQSVDLVAKNTAEALGNYLYRQQMSANHIGSMLPTGALGLEDYRWVEDYFLRHAEDYSFFGNGFFLLDTNGILRVDYPSHPELRGHDYSFRPYFQRTMAARKGIVGQPYRSSRTGRGVLTFTSYVASADGTPIGVVGCSTLLETDEILSQIRARKVGEGGYSYVYDKSRLMILHPKDERMLTRDVPVGANKWFDAAIDGFEGPAETVNSKGVKMLVAFRPVPGSDWIVGSQVPANEAFAPLIASQRRFIVFIFLGSLGAAAIGLIFVRRSMRDLDTLEQVTASLAIPESGSRDPNEALAIETVKLNPLSTHPEFGPLTNTIGELYSRLGRSLSETQQMAGELDDAYQQLKATQSQILQQEKMASVGQLAAGVAHEINNPMGFITSNLSSLKRHQNKLTAYVEQLESWLQEEGSSDILAQMKDLKKKQKISYVLEDINDLIEESSDGAVRVRDIVQNLKSFSRIDQTEFTQANINECLESTLAIAMNEIKYKATVEKDFGELPLLSCHPQQLNQVFLNILVNAAQAIEEKGEIKIKTQAKDGNIVIAISDNGSGISEEIRDKIFEPFFTTKEVGKGTGLGMSVSYEIIKNHQGQIKVDSEAGQGTTFTIELPLD